MKGIIAITVIIATTSFGFGLIKSATDAAPNTPTINNTTKEIMDMS